MEEISRKEAKRLKKRERELAKDREREKRVMGKKTPAEVTFFKQIKLVEEEAEQDYANRPTVKKKKGFAKLNDSLKRVSLKNMQKEIQGYGYEFKVSDYLKNAGLILVALVAGSIFFGLNVKWIIFLAAIVLLLAFPLITLAQFEIVANNDDFEQIVAYLEQMIIAFKNNPKILLAMKESRAIVEGKMLERLDEAIHIIETDAKSSDVYQRAFAVIENEYKCSRIRTLHRFIYVVENENSENYGESLDNLYMDVKEWQKRTYKFQAALSQTKNQLTILLGASAAIAGVFAYMMRTVEDSMLDEETGKSLIAIISNPVYQIATVFFFTAFVGIYTLVNTKINGSWLIKDLENPRDREIIKLMKQTALDDPQESRRNRLIATSMLTLPILIYALIDKNLIIGVVGLIFFVVVSKFADSNKKKKRKRIQEEVKQEFPLWMRDVAISLKNRVVVRAIIETEEMAAYVMKPFIRTFLMNVEKDPASIRPYMDFFGPYKAQELTTAIKTLYSIRTLSAEDSQRQVNDLIERNQELLAESERIRQDNSVAGLGFIGLLPMVLMSLLLMCYLMVMLVQFLGILGSV